MKKVSKISSIIFYLFSQILSQVPFLEIRPYAPPSFGQYPVSHSVDHHFPYTNQADDVFLRFDGKEFTENLLYPNCLSGSSCYDGHAGVDYYMPFDNPILAPADGYVLWSSFSPAADPCPGGITPNGDQGTIIVAHGNGYYTVYLHLNEPLNVSVGDNVIVGDTLGFNGNTGCAINAHLHFEIRKDNWFFDSNEPYVVDPFGWWGDSTDPIETIRGNRSEWLWVSNGLVDDGDNGFQRFSGPDWSYLNVGFNNDSWIAPATQNILDSRHYALWVPYIEQSSEHNIEIYIPPGLDASTEAIYELNIKHENGISSTTNIIVNQNTEPGFFHTIETIALPSGYNCSIILRDAVGSSSTGSNVVFDAIRFSPVTSYIKEENNKKNRFSNQIDIVSVFPNPFNSSTKIKYDIKKPGNVSIVILDMSGNSIDKHQNKNQLIGEYYFEWDGKTNTGRNLPTGIYFFSISLNGEKTTGKLMYLK